MQSVLRSLRAFELVAERQPARLSELAPELGFSKSTVQRILRTLESAGWIEAVDGDVTRWQVSARAHSALRGERSELELRKAAVPVMEALRDDTDETVHLSIPRPGHVMVVIDHAETRQELRIVAAVGTAFADTAAAGGIAVLATMDDDRVGDAIQAANEQAVAAHGGVDATTVRALIDAVRRDGYCVKPAESGQTIGIGAAITDGTHEAVAAIVLVVPVVRYRDEDRARLGVRVLAAATAVSAVLASR
ncbi:IclR family acetate operon transcriptional repressor [Compostimonas suwonensis]|uniref:IclR family acetate operon transcriptional repressor n=2 Tax=Compostimonas suwonensis TaxID=1048394 RepID=A0A2M9BB97_9MICO|nr:IclR family acetate operon transcriptional repressor [Compostimonas suwonensis]